MLDFSKKKTMQIVLGDGKIIDLATPKTKEYTKLIKTNGTEKDFIEASVIILNKNQQGLTFTEEEVEEDLLIDEMIQLFSEYMFFVAGLTNDPNSNSHLARVMAMMGESTITP